MDGNKKTPLNGMKIVVLVSQVAFTMITPIFMCLFIGMWLDNKYTSSHIYTLIGLLLGILTGYRNAYVLLRVYFKKEKKNDEMKDDGREK